MSEIPTALAELNEQEVARLVKERLDAGDDPVAVLDDCRRGMDIVGERYKAGDYFLSELIVSGEIFKDSMKLVEPHLKADATASATKIVLGTVKGDIHNIGKDIVAPILGMSGLLTPSFDSMKETIMASASNATRGMTVSRSGVTKRQVV